MSLLKELRKLTIVSMGFVALSYGVSPANAAPIVFASAGTCDGADTSGGAGLDCVTTTGHVSASIVETLDINEIKAMNFGNMSKPNAAPSAAVSTIVMDPTDGQRTLSTTEGIVLLHGAGATSGPGFTSNGGQSPGIYRVTGDTEGTAQQVYISFADTAGNGIDFAGESLYPTTNVIAVNGPGAGGTAHFDLNAFTISCTNSGNDVYGHYCENTDPVDVRVGGTLSTVNGQTYTAGKYTGVFNVMVSY